jgi:multidrug efflux pump subunit AcrB
VFIPLVFLPGLLGRIFREFSVTIIVAIFASGIVSLTLTPLMCARMLKDRKGGDGRTRMERWVGGSIQRIIAAYGRSLDKFRSRLAGRSHPGRLSGRTLVFLYAPPVLAPASGR